jgi:hypothetical protein
LASVACSRAVCRVTEQQLYRSQVVDLGRLRSAQRVCAVSRTIETGALHPPMDDAGVLPRREMRPPAERAREPGSTPVSVEGSQPLADCAPGLLGDLELDGRPVFFWTTVARSRTLPPAHTSSILTQMRSQSRNLLSMARLNIARSRMRPKLQANTNCPDVLRLQRTLLADQATLFQGSSGSEGVGFSAAMVISGEADPFHHC